MRRTMLLALALCGCGYDERDLDGEGCDEPDGCWQAPSDRLTVEGDVCWQAAPNEDELKILVVLDRSGSWQFTDPSGYHVSAIRELVAQQGAQAFTQIGIVAFNAGIEATPFTRDAAVLENAINSAFASGQTDYQGALAAARSMLESDLATLTELERRRTAYAVLFISDGLPDPRCLAGCNNDPGCWAYCDVDPDADPDDDLDPADFEGLFTAFEGACNEYNSDGQILSAVRDLADLAADNQVREFVFHTISAIPDPEPYLPVLCDGIAPYDMDVASALMRQMADEGGGSAIQWNTNDTLDLTRVELPAAGAVGIVPDLHRLVLWNATGLFGSEPDSDGDGLSDRAEDEAGTSATNADTDGDGVDDGAERTLGLDPVDAGDGACEQNGDADADGLSACAEMQAGTADDRFDSDADGLPDGVEVRFGTDPAVDDALGDLDDDGVTNGDEVAQGMNPRVADAAERASLALSVETDAPVVSETDESCTHFSVTNMRLLPTRAVDGRPAGQNTLRVTATTRLEGFLPWTGAAACARPSLLADGNTRPAGTLTLPRSAFVDPELDGAVPCQEP